MLTTMPSNDPEEWAVIPDLEHQMVPQGRSTHLSNAEIDSKLFLRICGRIKSSAL